MKLVAIRQLVGIYGRVDAGQTFEAPADVAEQLLARGLVRHALPPRIAYEICNGKFIPGPAWPAVESERK